jgi:hypothetical protein
MKRKCLPILTSPYVGYRFAINFVIGFGFTLNVTASERDEGGGLKITETSLYLCWEGSKNGYIEFEVK